MRAPALAGTMVLGLAVIVRQARRQVGAGLARQRLRAGLGVGPGIGAVPAWFAALLQRSGVHDDPTGWWRTAVVGVPVLLVSVAVTFGPGAVLAAVPTMALAPLALGRVAAGRAARRREMALPSMLEDIAGALRGGASLRQALAVAARRAQPALAGDLCSVVAAVDRGAPMVAQLDAWSEADRSDGLRLAVAALTLGAETGGRQAHALDSVAATLRDRLAVERELAALSSQARASALVMGVAPVAFAAFATAADPRTGRFLVGTPGGWACLASGVALDAVAAWWMLRLTGAVR